MTAENPKVDAFLDRATRWQDEMRALRELLLDCGLTEELKWGKPCYTAHGGNIVTGRHLTQAEAADLLGTSQPTVSNLMNGRLEGFSLERFARFLNTLDRDVDIVVRRRPRSRKAARLRVTMG